MTERQRLRQACLDSRRLARENHALRADLQQLKKEFAKLEAAYFNVQVERDAADVLLDAAMNELEHSRPS